MSRPQYAVGIDLGTTNSALAYVRLDDADRRVEMFPVRQLVREGIVEERPGLPSFQYLGAGHDLAPGSLALPWDNDRDYAVGEFARIQGAKVPGRLITSAKSWLCHAGVDRESPILPWSADEDVEKKSPVTVSADFLRHLRECWNRGFADAPLEEQDIVLTVPASFDEVARELTVKAADMAGLSRVVLLEEPQAACYAWVNERQDSWQDQLSDIRLVLVVDIGGGTTDFSLVAVRSEEGVLGLERLAVGDHLLLGGDNIDVALARIVEPRLGSKLDSQRWQALTSLCRSAKEALLKPGAEDDFSLSLVGRGSAVIGGTITATLKREEVHNLVLDGFLPQRKASERPRRQAMVGLQEWGLPFATEAEITRHLAVFLSNHLDGQPTDSEGNALPRWPDAILFNGGALKPDLVRERIHSIVSGWSAASPKLLHSGSLDLAVARGAAYYGLVRRGKGVRIRGGSPRAYFLGLDAGLSAPSDEIQTLCIAHRGMEEGQEVTVSEPQFEVLTNRAVSFPLYSSSTRLGDASASIVKADPETLTPLPPLRSVLRFGRKMEQRKIPVTLTSKLTEIGTLELWCNSLTTDHRWRLQFQLRDQKIDIDAEKSEQHEGEQLAESVIGEKQTEAAANLIRQVFPENNGEPVGDCVKLVRQLEATLKSGRDAWPLVTIRTLADVLWEGRNARRYSAEHEARWLNLMGFLMRPGFGAETDDWRIQNLWRMRSEGLSFDKAAQGRAEWWNLWKRLSGGLSKQQQQQLYNEVSPWLIPKKGGKAKMTKKGGPKPGPQEIREYWQLLATCERIAAEQKVKLGEVLINTLRKGTSSQSDIWALGRLGSRAPIYGPLNTVIPRKTAENWLETLLDRDWKHPDATLLAIVQIARCVGDRERDLDESLRGKAELRLGAMPKGARAAQLITKVVPLQSRERGRILDESLPAGIRIVEGNE